MLLFVLLSEKSVALLFQCQFVKAVFLTCGNKTSIAIFQKIVPNVNSANFWNVPLDTTSEFNINKIYTTQNKIRFLKKMVEVCAVNPDSICVQTPPVDHISLHSEYCDIFKTTLGRRINIY